MTLTQVRNDLGKLVFKEVPDDPNAAGSAGAKQAALQGRVRGWGERNPVAERREMAGAWGQEGALYPTAAEEKSWSLKSTLDGLSDWWWGFKEAVAHPFFSTETDLTYDQMMKEQERYDPNWTPQAHLEAYKKFKEDNPDAVHYLERAGVNLYTATLNSRNYNNFRLQVATTINDTIMGMRQAIFARENGSALQFIKQAAYGLRDPSIVRDMAYSTMLTMGFGAVDSLGVALEAAATRTAGTAATTAASRTLTAIGAGAVKNLGPMTGLIEGPTFNLLKSTLFKKAGEKFAHTLAARGGAIFV